LLLKIIDQIIASGEAFDEIRVVGHSLGAGVAALCGKGLKDKYGDSQNIHVYAFAPPAVASEPHAWEDFVTSFVLGDDVVPRITFEAISAFFRVPVEEDDEAAAILNLRMYPPGKLYLIDPPEEENPAQTVQVYSVQGGVFRIRVSGSMVKFHMGDSYHSFMEKLTN
jgi:uncharacterized protein (DUF1684 family)